ncbi:MAG: extracellular solute-binding protein, partial [Clostridiaceae bacterium]
QTMFYNTTILEEIGGDPEKLPTTWAEFNELADKAVEKGYYARTYEGANTLNGNLYPYIWQAGGDIIGKDNKILINSDKSLKAWEEIMRQYKAGYFPEDSITSLDHSPLFLEGKSLAAFSSAAILNVIKDEGMENYVIGQPLEGVTYGTTGMFVASAKSKNVDKAAEFVAVMTNADNQRAFNTLTNYIPSRESAIDIFDSNPDMKQLAEYVGMAKPGVIHPAARVFMANVQAKVQAMMEGSLTPKEAADEAAKMIENEM